MLWTVYDIEAVMHRAGRALAQLPADDLRRFGRQHAHWPALAEDGEPWMAAVGVFKQSRSDQTVVRMPATTQDIDALNLFLGTMIWIPQPGQRRFVRGSRAVIPEDIKAILLARSIGASWRRIKTLRKARYSARRGNSTEQNRRICRAAVLIIRDEISN